MSTRQPDPRALRLQALCKNGDTVQGQLPLASMPRLSESFCAAADGSARWSLHAYTRPVAGAEPQLWARLQASAVVPLLCQRCLAPMLQALQVDQSIRFVQGEALAERLDEESEEDVLSLPAHLNVHALLEDELILALPIVPRHEEVCPQPLLPDVALGGEGLDLPAAGQPAAEGGDKPNPFAVLASLKAPGKT